MRNPGYPFDSPEPWLHGYFQEMPAYAGYSAFRPHNYKHVLAQMQTASRWGIPATMPVSHQWYHRYRQQSGMHPSWETKLSAAGAAGYQNYAAAPAPQPVMQTAAPPPQYSPSPEQAAAMQRGYTGAPIPGISTPSYQRSVDTYRRMPTPSQQYQQQFDALQNRLEQQTFQIQAMQQQLESQQTYRRAHDQYNSQPWAQPNHTQFATNPQGAPYGAPGTFVAPGSAMPAQPAAPGYAQGIPPAYAAQPYRSQQYAPGATAPGMLPAMDPRAMAPSMNPAGPQYAPAPVQPMAQPGLMSIPQNNSYVMPQGIPQASTMMTDPRMAPAIQPSYPQGYPPNWSYGVTPAGQAAYPSMPAYSTQPGYGPQPAVPYGSGYRGAGIVQPQMPAQPMYQAQPIPTMMPGGYSSGAGR